MINETEEVVLRVLNGKLQLTRERAKPKESPNLNKLSNTKILPNFQQLNNMYAADGAWSSQETKARNPNYTADNNPSIQNGLKTDATNSASVSETETIQRFLSVCLQQFVDGNPSNNRTPQGGQLNKVN